MVTIDSLYLAVFRDVDPNQVRQARVGCGVGDAGNAGAVAMVARLILCLSPRSEKPAA